MMQQNLLLIMISNTFLIFKSILFWINLVLSVFLIGPIAFLLGLFSYRLCLIVSKIWCRYNLFFLKYFCSLSFKLLGPDLNSSQLIISRHQSAWETIFLAAFVQKPIFILKKELLMIPIFGWCLYLLKNISIDRADGRSSLRKIIKSCGEHVDKNRTLIIFPEGTRIAYGEQSILKKGIFKILDVLKMQSILMNHDAGKFWSKNSLIIKPGVICIETLSLEYTSDMDEIKQRIINHFA